MFLIYPMNFMPTCHLNHEHYYSYLIIAEIKFFNTDCKLPFRISLIKKNIEYKKFRSKNKIIKLTRSNNNYN